VWTNPVVWREIVTWAYGRKVLAVHATYLVLFAGAAWWAVGLAQSGELTRTAAMLLVGPLVVLGLMLVSAQAVTSVTGERDRGALDLLLVTELAPREIVLGKLLGTLYNTKWMIVLPAGLCGYFWQAGVVGLENTLYLVGGLLLLSLFVAVLGLHAATIYPSSLAAIAVSLGTLVFLLVGVAACIAILVAFSDPYGASFHVQLAPFLAFMVGGIVGLYLALGARSPSPAIGWAVVIAPPATFWAITSYLLDITLGVFLVTVAAYGFMTLAMLIPALTQFGRPVGRAE
jgi:ABC-type Na+ efflux pump permease subunit